MSERKERVTVTLDRALVDAATAAVAAGRADSVSGWVNRALVEHLANERRLAVLSTLLAEYEADYGELTPEELAVRERDDRRAALAVRGAARTSSRKRRRSRAA